MRSGESITLDNNSSLSYDIVQDASGKKHWLYDGNTSICRNGRFIAISSVLVPSKPFSDFSQITSSPTHTGSVNESASSTLPPTTFESLAMTVWRSFTVVFVVMYVSKYALWVEYTCCGKTFHLALKCCLWHVPESAKRVGIMFSLELSYAFWIWAKNKQLHVPSLKQTQGDVQFARLKNNGIIYNV